MRRLATLSLLWVLAAASTAAAASPDAEESPEPSDVPARVEPYARTMDVVRAVDQRFADLPSLEDVQNEESRTFDIGPVVAGSWIHVLPTFGSIMQFSPDPDDAGRWLGLGGAVVEVMLVADCVTTDVRPYLDDPSLGDPCAWRHTYLYQVSQAGDTQLLFDAGSPETP